MHVPPLLFAKQDLASVPGRQISSMTLFVSSVRFTEWCPAATQSGHRIGSHHETGRLCVLHFSQKSLPHISHCHRLPVSSSSIAPHQSHSYSPLLRSMFASPFRLHRDKWKFSVPSGFPLKRDDVRRMMHGGRCGKRMHAKSSRRDPRDRLCARVRIHRRRRRIEPSRNRTYDRTCPRCSPT